MTPIAGKSYVIENKKGVIDQVYITSGAKIVDGRVSNFFYYQAFYQGELTGSKESGYHGEGKDFLVLEEIDNTRITLNPTVPYSVLESLCTSLRDKLREDAERHYSEWIKPAMYGDIYEAWNATHGEEEGTLLYNTIQLMFDYE